MGDGAPDFEEQPTGFFNRARWYVGLAPETWGQRATPPYLVVLIILAVALPVAILARYLTGWSWAAYAGVGVASWLAAPIVNRVEAIYLRRLPDPPKHL